MALAFFELGGVLFKDLQVLEERLKWDRSAL